MLAAVIAGALLRGAEVVRGRLRYRTKQDGHASAATTCISGDLDAVRALIARDPSLARAHYTYRKPLYFAVRENRLDIARFPLEHDHNPMDLWLDDSPLEIARDRGYVEMEQLLTETLDDEVQRLVEGRTDCARAAGARSDTDARAAGC